MQLYPLKLIPVLKESIWGGDKLKTKYNKEAPFDKLAESWELTVRPDGMNIIASGEYAGMTLGEYIDKAGADVIAKGYDGDRFPLLIKFIDARDRLSIQVHPSDDYALKNESEYEKNEVWYIVQAEEGAELVLGLTKDYTKEAFDKAIADHTVESLLHHVKVHAGEVYFIPAGLVHAIGAGILICEIQQNSNITYRVYDYGRLGKDGKPRELHTKKATEAIINHSPEDIEQLRFAAARERTPTLLASCGKFTINRYAFTDLTLCVDETSFLSLTFIGGCGSIEAQGKAYAFAKGDTYYFPAGMGEFTLKSEGAVCIAARI